MKRVWTSISRWRPTLGLNPPTSGRPATPPQTLRIWRRSVAPIAGAVFIFGPTTTPLSIPATKIGPLKIVQRVERREDRLRKGSVVYLGPRRENPFVPIRHAYHTSWHPVSRWRPTLGFNPPASETHPTPAIRFVVKVGSQQRVSGEIFQIRPPRAIPVASPTFKTDRRLRVVYKDQRGFRGRVIRFGVKNPGDLPDTIGIPLQIFYPNISFWNTGRAAISEVRRSNPPLQENVNIRDFRLHVGQNQFRRGYSVALKLRRPNPAPTGTFNHGLVRITNFQITLNVKREVDSGEVSAVSTDVGGTSVLFNKAFKDVDSITATADSTTPCVVIYDFNDVPNPTGFSVLVFDMAGNRISKLVSWKARGIV